MLKMTARSLSTGLNRGQLFTVRTAFSLEEVHDEVLSFPGLRVSVHDLFIRLLDNLFRQLR